MYAEMEVPTEEIQMAEVTVINDTLAKYEFDRRNRPNREHWTPTHRLLEAVLLDAWNLVTSPGWAKTRQAKEAMAWIANDNDEDPFDFLFICQTLGLSGQRVRKALDELISARLRISEQKVLLLQDFRTSLKD